MITGKREGKGKEDKLSLIIVWIVFITLLSVLVLDCTESFY